MLSVVIEYIIENMAKASIDLGYYKTTTMREHLSRTHWKTFYSKSWGCCHDSSLYCSGTFSFICGYISLKARLKFFLFELLGIRWNTNGPYVFMKIVQRRQNKTASLSMNLSKTANESVIKPSVPKVVFFAAGVARCVILPQKIYLSKFYRALRFKDSVMLSCFTLW